jgi:multidrug efflux system outer membrane protein
MRNFLASLSMMLLLAACTVGPRYVQPDLALPEVFDQAGDADGEPAVGTLLWSSFDSRELDTLIARALEANTTIAQSLARLDETRALDGLRIFSWFPTVTASGGGERNKPSGSDPFLPPDQGTTETWRAGLDASWEIDLFGSLRNDSDAIQYRAEADAAALHAVQLSIVAETAQSWFALIGARRQLELQTAQLAGLENSVEILQALLDAGRGDDLDLARGQAQARSLAALLPQSEAEVARQEQRLAVLTAWPVATLRNQLAQGTDLPSLPAVIQVGSPEDWLRRRPDIRAAERRLAEATAEVGVEVAEYFPKLNLLGSFGWTALEASELGGSSTERWSVGPSLSWRFLDIGRVRQRTRAASARADGAEAAYRETVLLALEETENALAGYRATNRSQLELNAAAAASRRAYELAKLRFDEGRDGYLAVLDAERTLLDLERQALDADTGRATALAVLYKVLAGDFVRAE